jgi:hypothetical protein
MVHYWLLAEEDLRRINDRRHAEHDCVLWWNQVQADDVGRFTESSATPTEPAICVVNGPRLFVSQMKN